MARKTVTGPESRVVSEEPNTRDSSLATKNAARLSLPDWQAGAGARGAKEELAASKIKGIDEVGLVRVALANPDEVRAEGGSPISVRLNPDADTVFTLKQEGDLVTAKAEGLPVLSLSAKQTLKESKETAQVSTSDLVQWANRQVAAIRQEAAQIRGIKPAAQATLGVDLDAFGDVRANSRFFDLFVLQARSEQRAHFRNIRFVFESGDRALLETAFRRLAKLDKDSEFNGSLTSLFLDQAPKGVPFIRLQLPTKASQPGASRYWSLHKPESGSEAITYTSAILAAFYGALVDLSPNAAMDPHFLQMTSIAVGREVTSSVARSVLNWTASSDQRALYVLGRPLVKIVDSSVAAWHRMMQQIARAA